MNNITGDFYIYLNQYDIQQPWCLTHVLSETEVTEYRFGHVELKVILIESVDTYHVTPHRNRYKLLAKNCELIRENGIGELRSLSQ